MILGDLRTACAEVTERAAHVRIDTSRIPEYASTLGVQPAPVASVIDPADRERGAAFWLTLSAVNFGSGWFPTLRKRPGQSGYDTVAAGVRRRFEQAGGWTAAELARIDALELAAVTGQSPEHELMALFAASLRDLGTRLLVHFDGSFWAPVERAGDSATALVATLSTWSCFADVSSYGELSLPFLKRAQLAAADLARGGVAPFLDLARLTMFADNLVPHVLRIDGILSFDEELRGAIEREEMIEHGSAEEVEIRACALHAVELIVASAPGLTAAGVDEQLWNRGRGARYKAVPRHRSRCTAY
jgi:hypothetical protein